MVTFTTQRSNSMVSPRETGQVGLNAAMCGWCGTCTVQMLCIKHLQTNWLGASSSLTDETARLPNAKANEAMEARCHGKQQRGMSISFRFVIAV